MRIPETFEFLRINHIDGNTITFMLNKEHYYGEER